MKPICVRCARFFRPSKTGFYFIEGMPTISGAEPGTAEPYNWAPYKLWVGDKWRCDGCGAEIISGVGRAPIAEHYEEKFQRNIALLKPELQVNDC